MPALARKGIPKSVPRKKLLLQDYGAVLKTTEELSDQSENASS